MGRMHKKLCVNWTQPINFTISGKQIEEKNYSNFYYG